MALESLEKKENSNSKVLRLTLLALVSFFVLAGWLLVKGFELEKPQVAMPADVGRIGPNKEIAMVLTDAKSGVRFVQVTLKQDKTVAVLFEKRFPREGYLTDAGPNRVEERFVIAPSSHGIKDGAAELVVRVRDYSWWGWFHGSLTEGKYQVVVDTRPPMVSIVESPRGIRSGSAGLVVYRVNEPVGQHGVLINGLYHPGFPLPKAGEGVYGATIGLPYDLERLEESVVSAVDLAGNASKAVFGMSFRKGRITRDRINISDNFLNMKLPEFVQHYPEMTGTPIEQYLYVNKEIRSRNYRTVKEICSKSVAERLWDGAFKRMAGSRMAGFADVRGYYYQGKEIDVETHLGVDIASLRHAEVPAANRGVVVFADYLGIYGYTVILDHGQGVFTLYSHLSQISVARDARVEKGAVLGLTGTSGLAGGDHLHFSVLVNGVFVNPIEWWDAHWLQNNILHSM